MAKVVGDVFARKLSKLERKLDRLERGINDMRTELSSALGMVRNLMERYYSEVSQLRCEATADKNAADNAAALDVALLRLLTERRDALHTSGYAQPIAKPRDGPVFTGGVDLP